MPMLTLACIVIFVAVAALAQVLAIWVAGSVTHVKDVTVWRAIAVLGLQVLLYAIVGLLAVSIFFIPASILSDGPRLLLLWTYLLVASATWLAAARYVLRSNWWQAAGIYIAQSVAAVACTLALRLLVLESFVVPTNGMAPTIVGNRYHGRCPQCAGSVIVTAVRDAYGMLEPTADGICEKCWLIQAAEPPLESLQGGDRIVSSKVERPRRFDTVVYDSPQAPGQNWVHRLVGLPGEQVSIRSGRLWIDGREILPPPGLEKLRYSFDPIIGDHFGTEDPTWQLGTNEYFVHGDNTDRSMAISVPSGKKPSTALLSPFIGRRLEHGCCVRKSRDRRR